MYCPRQTTILRGKPPGHYRTRAMGAAAFTAEAASACCIRIRGVDMHLCSCFGERCYYEAFRDKHLDGYSTHILRY